MAKGNFIVGKMIGSVGDVTAYARGNDQIVRRRNRYVKNPRTQAQTINRIIAATIGSAYSRLSAIADHSFQGHSTKADNMARFLKANQGMVRSAMIANGIAFDYGNFQAIGQKGIVANTYVISEGTLPTIAVSISEIEQDNNSPHFYHGGAAGTTVTYESLANALGLKRGDQLTFVAVVNNRDIVDPELDSAWGTDSRLVFCRVILDPKQSSGSDAPMSTAFLTEQGAVNLPNPRNQYTESFKFAFAEGEILFNPVAVVASSDGVVAATVIASRKEGSSWLRSTQQLYVAQPWRDMPTLQNAIDASYPSTGAIADPSKFLNAAVQG